MRRLRVFRLIAVPVLVLVLFLFASCSSGSGGGGGADAASGKSISGLVTDMAQVPLEGVLVSAYGQSATTDAAGKFSFSADVPSDRAVVAFQKENYFDQSIGKKPSANGSTNIRVAMLAKELAGTVDNATGGKIATSKMQGDFAPDSFARMDGSSIAGSIRLFAAYLDPDDPTFGKAMPGGDFSAKDAAGDAGILTSFGALVIEAEEEAGGESAQLKKQADLCLAIPASMLASAPDSIPVWRLGFGAGWEEVATAQRVGDRYCFFVTVLGAINCDIFGRSALVTGKVCNGSSPVADTEVRIGQISTQTDDTGEYSVLVQTDVKLTLVTSFGSATAGPLEAASTNVVDIGCPGSDGGADGDGGDPDGGGGDTWTDPVTGLVWRTHPESTAAEAFDWAVTACQSLGNGWRLPTIRELRSLIRGCPDMQCGATDASCGACGVTDSCLKVYPCKAKDVSDLSCYGCQQYAGPGESGCYWPPEITQSCGSTWSSSVEGTDAWQVNFTDATLGGSYTSSLGAGYVRCVRTGP